MLYDSPKKFDMESDLYESFFHLLIDLQRELETINACPFQYIITTTTPPPEECEPIVCLELDASKKNEKGLLLKKNVVQPFTGNRQAVLF